MRTAVDLTGDGLRRAQLDGEPYIDPKDPESEDIFERCNGQTRNKWSEGTSDYSDCPYITVGNFGRNKEGVTAGPSGHGIEVAVDFRRGYGKIKNVFGNEPRGNDYDFGEKMRELQPGWNLSWLPEMMIYDDRHEYMTWGIFETLPLEKAHCYPGTPPEACNIWPSSSTVAVGMKYGLGRNLLHTKDTEDTLEKGFWTAEQFVFKLNSSMTIVNKDLCTTLQGEWVVGTASGLVQRVLQAVACGIAWAVCMLR